MSNGGVTAKEKVTWLKLCQFTVEVWNPLKARYAIAAPMPPPTSATATDSSMTETTTAPLPKPSARRVAISRVRAETELYIVLSAPKMAPTAIKKATKYPKVVIKEL